MSIPGERKDETLPAVAKTAAAVAAKWYRFDPSVGSPQDAILVAVLGGFAHGVSETATDAIGDTFAITSKGLRFVDSAAAVITAGQFVMPDASGNTVAFAAAASHYATGLAYSTTTGGAGEQVAVEIFQEPISDPDAFPG